MTGADRTIVITGCSSGIGEHCALALKARGWNVIATARRDEDIARLQAEDLDVIRLDYADPTTVASAAYAVSEITGGRLYALFNNGAYGQPGALEDLPAEALRAQLDANVLGWHDLTCRLLPLMRANGSARIVQNSSVLGRVALKWRGAYAASKFAVEALSDTLRLELRGTGIHVSLIEPGPVVSRFNVNARAHFERHIDVEHSPHKERYRTLMRRFDKAHKSPLAVGPEVVLKKLRHALESPRPRARYHVTLATPALIYLDRILPQRLIDPIFDWASDK